MIKLLDVGLQKFVIGFVQESFQGVERIDCVADFWLLLIDGYSLFLLIDEKRLVDMRYLTSRRLPARLPVARDQKFVVPCPPVSY